MIIDFDKKLTCSIKYLAVNQNNMRKHIPRFFNGKMLIFAKLSQMSFIYDLIEVFYFPDENIKKKYMKNTLLKNFLIMYLQIQTAPA